MLTWLRWILERFGERTREERGVRPLEDLSRDVRYALRQVRKNPWFSLLASLTLALGIASGLLASTDPLTFLGVGSFLGLTVVAAVAAPALRASAVDPVRVLKQE